MPDEEHAKIKAEAAAMGLSMASYTAWLIYKARGVELPEYLAAEVRAAEAAQDQGALIA